MTGKSEVSFPVADHRELIGSRNLSAFLSSNAPSISLEIRFVVALPDIGRKYRYPMGWVTAGWAFTLDLSSMY